MKTIALLTDFGYQDNCVGVVKAVILKINPRIGLVDICHLIKPFDILHGALILKSAYAYFPHETIFLAVIDPGVGSRRKAIIVKTDHYYFVAPDNGLLSCVLQKEKPRQIISITNSRYFLKPVSATFHGRDIFAPVAAHLSKGVPLKNFGSPQRDYIKCHFPNVAIDHKNHCLAGEVIDIDHFGNIVSNIELQHLKQIKAPHVIQIKNHQIKGVSRSYADAKPGELLAVIGSKGYLEISINQSSASQKLKIHKGQTLKVCSKR